MHPEMIARQATKPPLHACRDKNGNLIMERRLGEIYNHLSHAYLVVAPSANETDPAAADDLDLAVDPDVAPRSLFASGIGDVPAEHVVFGKPRAQNKAKEPSPRLARLALRDGEVC